MSILLRLKRWYIFILTFGGYVLLLIFFWFIAITGAEIPALSGLTYRAIPIVKTMSFVIANFWMFAIGTRLYPRQEYYRNSLMLLIFRWSIYFATFATIARIMIFPKVHFYGPINEYLLFLTIAGGIYCSYFAARLLNSVEQERAVRFRGFVGDFILFIFYPIGVWWLQPRINRIFGNGDRVYDPDAPLDHHVTN